ncbi:hypothetical protein PIB30_100582, partial [Stylosanthes scabra]|nr:hypothetical protein [Stylosanthes scabra]
YTTLLPPPPDLSPCCRRAFAASSFDSSSLAVPWHCHPFRFCPCYSATARDIVQFVCDPHRSAAGRRLSSLRCASLKPLPP